MTATVPERLRAAAALFEERNAAYGDNYRTMGPVLHAMFPGGVTIDSPEQWQRIYTVVMAAMKITRYSQNVLRGGHQDSLDDLAVYAQMGAYTDDLARQASQYVGEWRGTGGARGAGGS